MTIRKPDVLTPTQKFYIEAYLYRKYNREALLLIERPMKVSQRRANEQARREFRRQDH